MQLHPYLQKILVCALLLSLMFLTFGIRIQGVEHLPAGHFTENDAFLYQWMADEIAEHGTLPERDMLRWFPLGRDNTQLLPLYSYAIAYTHKALAWFFPALTRYHVQLYITAICFTLGLGVLFLLLARTHGLLFASIVAILKEYLIWILMFVPGLYLISPAYRSGYTYATHLAELTLGPPITVFIMRGLRYLFLKYYPPLRPHARKLAGGLTLFGIAIGVGYILLQSGTFENTAFIFQETRLMKDMTELVDPNFGYWPARYGTVFMLGSLGLILGSLYLWKQNGIPLAITLSLFTATTFFRWPLSKWIGEGKSRNGYLLRLQLLF